MNILDSSALIEILHETPKSERILKDIGSELAVTTVFNMHEMLRCAMPKELPVLSKIFSEIKILEYDKDCALISSGLNANLKKQGREIGEIDVFIASIGIKNEAVLVTLDKHFARIKGLKTRIY